MRNIPIINQTIEIFPEDLKKIYEYLHPKNGKLFKEYLNEIILSGEKEIEFLPWKDKEGTPQLTPLSEI